MILSALKQHGHKIIRNKAYTGDGGVDGRVIINGTKVIIQAKRYKSHINKQHVEEFAALCRKSKCLGLFVHTGKTGAASRAAANTSQVIDIVSGERMLKMLSGACFRLQVM